jgi:hypothetical protein
MSNTMNHHHLNMLDGISSDLVSLLLSTDLCNKIDEIADTLATLFEFTGNDEGFISLVCTELQKYSPAPPGTPPWTD